MAKCPPVTPEERARAIDRSRRMFQTDLESNLATAEARGEVRGAYSKALTIAKNLLSMNMSLDQVADLTGLTREEVEGLQ